MKTETKTEQQINTMINQMGACGVTQGYLEIRGLKAVVKAETITYGKTETGVELKFYFNSITNGSIIAFQYNEGRDIYECWATEKGVKVYENKNIYFDQFKEVFETIFLKLGGLQ